MPKPFSFDQAWVFAVSPADLWAVLSQTDRFQVWWPWLRTFDSEGLVEGTTAQCVVRAPVPYSLSFQVAIVTVEPGLLVDTKVSGDLEGPARLEVAAHAHGAEARLSWDLELRDPLLRAGSRAARPVMEWGHNWIIDSGVRQFRRVALGDRPG